MKKYGYKYGWDLESGGILLEKTETSLSKEPRPVYSQELDILGFNRYWKYEKTDDIPIMWAEANNYIYRGKLVAQIKGGTLSCAPQIILIDDPEPDNGALSPVDIGLMVAKNMELIEQKANETKKIIENIYTEYQNKVDVFYVAFSGGKDSIVTLDLVQSALSSNMFKVLFGDTGMEFPDTYKTIEYVNRYCRDKGIEFIHASATQKPEDTWKLFGPPATVNRWCCSVHKTAPQILSLRKATGKDNFRGMAFIGVRAAESIARSEYELLSLGEKHKGQYSCNPILEWNSAELYLYIYSQHLYINEAYKKGNRRAGCLVCPRAAERSDFFANRCYPREFGSLVDSIKNSYRNHFLSEEKLNEFVENGGWKARKNGRDLDIEAGYEEERKNDKIVVTIKHPKTDWREWIKTIGVVISSTSPYFIQSNGNTYTFELEENESTGIKVSVDAALVKQEPTFIKLFKNVFKKVASCIQCKVCEADCPFGCIHMEDGSMWIDNNCHHCSQCHKVEKGCLVFKSIEKPKGINMKSKNQSLNCYSHHAPKLDWFVQFFKYKNEFDQNHTLGSNMYDFFKRFLRDSGLLEGNEISTLSYMIDRIGLDNPSGWAIMLTNLSYTPQINWLVRRLSFGEVYTKDYVLNALIEDGAKESWVLDIWSSFTRIANLPFSQVGFGTMSVEGKKAVAIKRETWQNPTQEVVLYCLYKFAEACGDYKQFTLTRLMDGDVESDGITPTQIFGLDKETMTAVLNGLSANYPEFIHVSFTLDLDNITLSDDKTSKDVLELFK